ncbi:hypothetical protein AXG93_1154s1790 [Marchantia polymorpha subsp. ruderalis]|uniref:histidinol-phosphate transaminase n=1 Tax=Marchantia polymorpha subsp. ruderalis TaxID=1480154 RepID=A0A176WT51_MARPO|nr:hypothetical protein AXG93_1154s1790 [Marchantia polymorpha subsp. ruderalis]
MLALGGSPPAGTLSFSNTITKQAFTTELNGFFSAENSSRCSSSIRASAVPLVKEAASGVNFIRPHLRNLAPYTPIEPFEILSARLGRAPQDIVKLDANENPYGPPPEVMEALGNMQFPNIYPDPESRRLRAALAKDSGLGAEHILVGCGADELIDLIMRCTLEQNDTVLDCPPTFTMYAFDTAVNGANLVKVPRNKDFSLDVPAILMAIEKHKPKLIFLTSPNNPDGSLIKEDELLEILKQDVLVVLDEAYIEFASEPSRMTWVKEHENLIVLRTFSKRAGLAGLRVGYGAFPLGIIDYLWRAKQPYNVSVAAEVAACAALDNTAYLEDVKVKLVNERDRLYGLLLDVPFLTPYPSHSNFILCSVTDASKSAKQLKADLAKEGVMVRHYDNQELRNYIRISVGKPQHTDAFFNALAKVA